MRAHGPDLSGHQYFFNAEMPKWKFDFVWNKYSEGVTGSNSMDYNIWNGSAGHMKRYLGIRNMIKKFYSFSGMKRGVFPI